MAKQFTLKELADIIATSKELRSKARPSLTCLYDDFIATAHKLIAEHERAEKVAQSRSKSESEVEETPSDSEGSDNE